VNNAPALFIPLRSEYFDDFARGEKHVERRIYGKRWNERTCAIGRPVVLSRGYGKWSRLNGVVIGFELNTAPWLREDWVACYGPGRALVAACITIEVHRVRIESLLSGGV
jgi:hypothetical protein